MTGSRPEKKATKILEFLYSEFFSLHIKETLLPFNFFIMPLISIFDTFANLERAIFACTMFKNHISTKSFNASETSYKMPEIAFGILAS